jgi:TrmH family RNA methyltransferase
MNGDGWPGTVVTSATNPRVRAAIALRDRRDRDRAGRALVDGAREVARALDGGVRILEVFVDAAGPRDAPTSALLDRLAATDATRTQVAGPALARLAFGDRASEVVAVVETPSTGLDRLAPLLAAAADPLVIVVEDVEKPGNLGAIARSADGAGATALVAAVGRAAAVDPWNPNAIRASLGTVFTLPIAVAPTDAVLDLLRATDMRIVAARVQASTPHHAEDLRGRLAIAVGSEALGLGPAWLAPDVAGVRLPMRGHADSLNVAATAAVLLYEALRQRDRSPGTA